MKRHEGGCRCGAVRYALLEEPSASGICHCASCRRAASSPGLPFLTIKASALLLLRGGPATYRSSPRVTRSFCGRCGSPLFYHNDDIPHEIDVMTCSLDEPDIFPPTFAIWVMDAPAWSSPGDLPAFTTTRGGQ